MEGEGGHSLRIKLELNSVIVKSRTVCLIVVLPIVFPAIQRPEQLVPYPYQRNPKGNHPAEGKGSWGVDPSVEA